MLFVRHCPPLATRLLYLVCIWCLGSYGAIPIQQLLWFKSNNYGDLRRRSIGWPPLVSTKCSTSAATTPPGPEHCIAIRDSAAQLGIECVQTNMGHRKGG
uniref:Uncharacterized protein n=1 Tax=Anopheles darlingi TaxID=43151 RepID=A0A2M4DA81_ANODA